MYTYVALAMVALELHPLGAVFHVSQSNEDEEVGVVLPFTRWGQLFTIEPPTFISTVHLWQ